MSTKTLLEVQASVQDFLNEARFCAENGKGFAAMCTVFPVILAISEAVNPGLRHDDDLIMAFVASMADKRSWLVAPSKGAIVVTDKELGEILTNLRNALAHALSQPIDVVLVNTVAEVVSNPAAPSDRWFIGTTELVEAVRDAASRLIAANAHMTFDPKPRGTTERAPAVGESAPWGPSASAIDLTNHYPPPDD
jgi:hypothetical protein